MTDKNKRIKTIFNALTIGGIVLTAILCIWGYTSGVFTSADKMKEFVGQYGILGPVVIILSQIVQVVIPILPMGIGLLAGVMIYGPLVGFTYNYIGIIIGSILAFLMARRLGQSYVQNSVSEKVYNKYINWTNDEKKFNRLFALAIFFPVSPDDFLCMLAGVTKMKLKTFIIIIMICKPFSIITYSYGLQALLNWIVSLFH